MKLVVTLFLFWVVGLGNGFTQEVNTPKIINGAQFELAINSMVTKIVAVNPLGNLHNVSHEGYYAILKIEKGKVVQIAYPEWIDPIITRQSEFALKDINERIGEKKFELVNFLLSYKITKIEQ